MNSAGRECVSQVHMYALHKVLFLAFMSVTLYFNEVESCAVQPMLYNNTEVSKDSKGTPIVGVSATNSIMRTSNSQKHLHSSNHLKAC